MLATGDTIPAAAPPRSLAFRADINGLRAVAVLAVIAFHFGVPPFRGGFVGVDVFFVISGYLMTGIILGRMDKGSFSVPGFYLDRARRIVPALLVLVVAVLLLGWFVLLPDEYILLARHAGSSATFASNLLYWREAGYFDAGVDQKWLLHTWSLSVEWQFYLLYPLLMLGVARFAPGRMRAALAVIALLSFANMIALSLSRPDTGFYLLPPRAWEMLVGGLVFLAPALTGRAAHAAQLWGLALILASAVLVPPSGWPNAWTILPVLGTALAILAARTDSVITGNRAAAWIGINSYSIYLWHWPVVVLMKRQGWAGDPAAIAAGVALSLLLGHLSWRFVERIARRATKAPRIHTAPIASTIRAHAAFALPVAAVLVASLAVWQARGVPQRFAPEVRAAAADAIPSPVPGSRRCYADVGEMPEACVLGPAQAPVLATVIGDSQADATLAGVLAAIPAGMPGGLAYTAYSACPPVLGARPDSPASRCGAFLQANLAPLARPRSTPLILIGRWTHYAEAPSLLFAGDTRATAASYRANLHASLCRLARAGPTYALLPTPEFPWWVSRELAHRLVRDSAAPDITMPASEHAARNREQTAIFRRAQAECGLRLLDPAPVLCPAGRCRGTANRRAILRDEQHLTAYGARLLAPIFAQVFAPAAPPGGAR